MSRKIATAFLLGYGLWIAFVYLSFVVCVPSHLVSAFTLGSLIAGTMVAAVSSRSLCNAAKDPFTWLRSIFFGLTQFFIFRALNAGDTTAVFCAASGALIVALPLAKKGLREHVGMREWAGALLAICGLVLLAPKLGITLNGFLSGIFQAVSIVTARKAGIRGQSISGNLAHGLLVAGLLCLPLCWSDAKALATESPMLIFYSALILLTQLYFLWISFSFSASAVSQVSQSRIAWSLLLNATWLNRFPSLQSIFGASVVLAAALLVVSKSQPSNSVP
jgi:uncharacterized membrane protein